MGLAWEILVEDHSDATNPWKIEFRDESNTSTGEPQLIVIFKCPKTKEWEYFTLHGRILRELAMKLAARLNPDGYRHR